MQYKVDRHIKCGLIFDGAILDVYRLGSFGSGVAVSGARH